jgi:hypothetical protein
MSIETLIERLITALDANTAARIGEVEQANDPGAPPNGAPSGSPTSAPRPRGRPPKNAPQDTAGPTAPPAEQVKVEVAPAAPEVAPTKGPSFSEVADKLIAVAETVSRDAAIKLLAQYGAAKAPDIKPAAYAMFIAAADGLLAAKAAAPASPGAGLI